MQIYLTISDEVWRDPKTDIVNTVQTFFQIRQLLLHAYKRMKRLSLQHILLRVLKKNIITICIYQTVLHNLLVEKSLTVNWAPDLIRQSFFFLLKFCSNIYISWFYLYILYCLSCSSLAKIKSFWNSWFLICLVQWLPFYLALAFSKAQCLARTCSGHRFYL